MNCEQSRQYICEYLDGLLNPETQEALEAHLAQCVQCRAEIHELKASIAWLQQAEEVQPPANLRQNVLLKLQSEAKIKQVFLPKQILQCVAAAAVFILLVAGNVLPPGGKNELATQNEIFLMGAREAFEVAENAGESQEILSIEEDIPLDMKQVQENATVQDSPPQFASAPEKAAGGLKGPSWRDWLNVIGIPVFLILIWRLYIERKRCREE